MKRIGLPLAFIGVVCLCAGSAQAERIGGVTRRIGGVTQRIGGVTQRIGGVAQGSSYGLLARLPLGVYAGTRGDLAYTYGSQNYRPQMLFGPAHFVNAPRLVRPPQTGAWPGSMFPQPVLSPILGPYSGLPQGTPWVPY